MLTAEDGKVTRQEAIRALKIARQEILNDPDLDCVDTTSLMEEAIALAYQYLTTTK